MPAGVGANGCRGRSVAPGEPTPIYDMDFGALAIGVYDAATLLALGYVLTRLTGSATYQTGIDAPGGWPLAAQDEARVQELAPSRRGILVEPEATTRPHYARQLGTGNHGASPLQWDDTSGGPTYSDSGVDPLGGGSGLNARRIQLAAGATYSRYAYEVAASGAHTVSLWRRWHSGSGTHQWGCGIGAATHDLSTATETWQRRILTTAGNGVSNYYVIPASGGGGMGAGPGNVAQDVLVDMLQWEAGSIATSVILANGASTTRHAETLVTAAGVAATMLGAGGRLGLLLDLVPLGPLSLMAGTPRFWRWAASGGASSYVSVAPSTRELTLSVAGGSPYTFATPLPDPARADSMSLWVEAGDGSSASVAKAWINDGPVTHLGTGPAQPAISGDAASLYLLQSGGADHLPGMVRRIRAYAAGERPSKAA